jgi:hypothetical protein
LDWFRDQSPNVTSAQPSIEHSLQPPQFRVVRREWQEPAEPAELAQEWCSKNPALGRV